MRHGKIYGTVMLAGVMFSGVKKLYKIAKDFFVRREMSHRGVRSMPIEPLMISVEPRSQLAISQLMVRDSRMTRSVVDLLQ